MKSPQSDRPSHRLRRVPRVETLETRELLTVIITHHVPPISQIRPIPHAAAVSVGASSPIEQAKLGVTNVSQGNPGSATAPPPDAAGGLPTAHEVRRQKYVGRFKGDYILGPGRYTDQALALSSLGYGGSNQSFHLWTNMRIVVSNDPTVAPTGQIYIIPWNVGTTGTQLILDLTGDASTAVRGVPTHYTWSVDATSAGLYNSATGEGTLDITFFQPGRGTVPGSKRGQLQFAINGFVNVAGIFSDISVLGNLPNGRR